MNQLCGAQLPSDQRDGRLLEGRASLPRLAHSSTTRTNGLQPAQYREAVRLGSLLTSALGAEEQVCTGKPKRHRREQARDRLGACRQVRQPSISWTRIHCTPSSRRPAMARLPEISAWCSSRPPPVPRGRARRQQRGSGTTKRTFVVRRYDTVRAPNEKKRQLARSCGASGKLEALRSN